MLRERVTEARLLVLGNARPVVYGGLRNQTMPLRISSAKLRIVHAGLLVEQRIDVKFTKAVWSPALVHECRAGEVLEHSFQMVPRGSRGPNQS